MAGTRIAEAFVAISAEMGSLRSGLRQSQGMVSASVNQMQASLGQLSGTINSLLGLAGFSLSAAGIYQIGKNLLFAGDAAAKLKNSFTVLLEGNEQKADKLISKMREFTALTPFSEQQVSSAVTALLPFEKEIDKVFEMLTSLGDAASVSADGLSSFPRVTRAITQMMGKNKISAEEMMQLAEAGIPAWKSLATAIGKSVAETQELSRKGKLGGESIHKFIAQLGKDFAGSMEKQSQTIEGLLSTISDNIKVRSVKAFQPLYESAQAAFSKVAGYVQSSEFTGLMDGLARSVEVVRANMFAAADMVKKWWGELGSSAKTAIKWIALITPIVAVALPLIKAVSFAFAMMFPTGLLRLPLTLLGSIVGTVTSLATAAGKAGSVIASAFTGTASTALKQLRERLGNVLDHTKNMGRIFGSLVQSGTVGAFNLLGVGAERLGAGLQKAATLGVGALSRIDALARSLPWDKAFAGISTGANVAFNTMEATAFASFRGISAVASAAWPAIKGAMKFMTLRTDWDGLVTAANTSWKQIIQISKGSASAVKAAIMPIGGASWQAWKSVEIGAITAWKVVRNTFDKEYLKATWVGGVASAASAAWQVIKSSVKFMTLRTDWDGLVATASKSWQTIAQISKGAANAVKSAIMPIGGTAWTAWKTVEIGAVTAWKVIRNTMNREYLKSTWADMKMSAWQSWKSVQLGAVTTWKIIRNTMNKEYLKATWTDMKTAAMNAWSSIKTRFSALGPQIGVALRTGVNMAWTGIIAAGKATFATLGSLAAKTGAMMGRSLRAVGGGLSGIAGGLAGLSMIGGAFAFLAPFQTMLIVIPQVMSLLGSVGMVVGALASPFGLVAGAIVGGLALWTRYSETGKEALDSVKKAFSPLWDTATDTFGGIKDAMASGDLKLAGQIGMAGLQSVFYQGMNGILSRWGEWAKATVEVFAGAMNQVATLWITTQGKISKGILSMAENKGVVGDVMAKLLGVDIREEKAVNERKMSQKQGLSFQVSEWRDALSKVGGNGTVESGQFQGWSKQELEQKIQQALGKMQQTGYGLTDQQLEVAGPEEARAAIDQQVQESLAGIDEMTANAITAYDEFASTAGDKATEAEAELARLRQEALDKRAQLEKDRAAKEEADKKASLADITELGADEEGAPAPTEKGRDPFIGFAELNRKMQEAMLKDTVAQDTLDVAKDQRDLLQKIADGFGATKQGAVNMLGQGLASAGANAFAASPIAGGLGEAGKFGSALVDSLFRMTQPPTAPGQQGDGSKETVSVLDKIRGIMETVAKNTEAKTKPIVAGA